MQHIRLGMQHPSGHATSRPSQRVRSALDSSKVYKVPPANYKSTTARDLELDAKVVDVKPAAEAGIILKHVEHFLTVACQDDGTVAASVAIQLLDHGIEDIAAVDVVLALRIENLSFCVSICTYVLVKQVN
jgi:hypothetical protein